MNSGSLAAEAEPLTTIPYLLSKKDDVWLKQKEQMCVYVNVPCVWGEVIDFSKMRDLLVNGTKVDAKTEDDF